MNSAATIHSSSWVVLEPIQYTSSATPTPTVPMNPTYSGCWEDMRGPGLPKRALVSVSRGGFLQ